MILVNGFNVYPHEVELVLTGHPGWPSRRYWVCRTHGPARLCGRTWCRRRGDR
ncbi:hypothetical protein NKG94_39700 [Micromonospora sp. M12]